MRWKDIGLEWKKRWPMRGVEWETYYHICACADGASNFCSKSEAGLAEELFGLDRVKYFRKVVDRLVERGLLLRGRGNVRYGKGDPVERDGIHIIQPAKWPSVNPTPAEPEPISSPPAKAAVTPEPKSKITIREAFNACDMRVNELVEQRKEAPPEQRTGIQNELDNVVSQRDALETALMWERKFIAETDSNLKEEKAFLMREWTRKAFDFGPIPKVTPSPSNDETHPEPEEATEEQSC